MAEARSSRTLSNESVQAILAGIGNFSQLSPAWNEALRCWLGNALDRATRRARQKRLTQSDVDRLERAYHRFCAEIAQLQDRDIPPPLIVSTDGATDWEHWIAGSQAFGFKRGRRAGSDWRLIAQLIALYEAVSERSASAAQPNGPTMRFLQAALNELANQSPLDLRSYFAAPTSGALKARLRRLRKSAIPSAAKELAFIKRPQGN